MLTAEGSDGSRFTRDRLSTSKKRINEGEEGVKSAWASTAEA